MRKINQIILHCSDSPHDHHDEISIIRQWHLERGFNDVGYHYFIQGNGNIQKGRNESVIGAHCRGQNMNSVGICLHGRDKFSIAQFKSLAKLLEEIKSRHKINRVSGHSEYDKGKTCPNFTIYDVIRITNLIK